MKIDFLDDFDVHQKLYPTHSEPQEIFQDKEISKKILKRLILEWGKEQRKIGFEAGRNFKDLWFKECASNENFVFTTFKDFEKHLQEKE